MSIPECYAKARAQKPGEKCDCACIFRRRERSAAKLTLWAAGVNMTPLHRQR